MWKPRLLAVLHLILFLKTTVATNTETDIINLGTVDNKTYFTDRILRNYTASRCFCKSKGMKLATITSESQAELLKCVYNPFNFSGWYWVGARDHEGNGNYTWTETGKAVQIFGTLEMAGWNNEDEVNNCLCFSANKQQKAYYFKRACYHEHYPICQRKSNSSKVSKKETKKIIVEETTDNSFGVFMDIK